MLGFFRKKYRITVTVKLFSGIHRDMNLDSYDLGKGLIIQAWNGEKLKHVLSRIGMQNQSTCAYFINSKRAGLGTRLKDGDDISCFKPSAGG
jgi:hypothetical protein